MRIAGDNECISRGGEAGVNRFSKHYGAAAAAGILLRLRNCSSRRNLGQDFQFAGEATAVRVGRKHAARPLDVMRVKTRRQPECPISKFLRSVIDRTEVDSVAVYRNFGRDGPFRVKNAPRLGIGDYRPAKTVRRKPSGSFAHEELDGFAFSVISNWTVCPLSTEVRR